MVNKNDISLPIAGGSLENEFGTFLSSLLVELFATVADIFTNCYQKASILMI
jgi:hypothetical protein